MSDTRTQVPAVEGLFTMDPDEPHLIGARGISQGSYFFPKDLAGSDPGCLGDDLEEILLSRTGKVWSFTNSGYPPPTPYIIQSEPYEPFVLAAVELDDQSIVVLGQMVDGVALEDVTVGMPVELALGVLYSDDDHDYMIWKWKPVAP
jgi:uncharacterized OB-fold protein